MIAMMLLCVSLVADYTDFQAPAPAQAPQTPQVVSPELLPDGRVAFRIYAPEARAIRLAASDIPGVGQTTQLAKNEESVWEVTIGPLAAGAYR